MATKSVVQSFLAATKLYVCFIILLPQLTTAQQNAGQLTTTNQTTAVTYTNPGWRRFITCEYKTCTFNCTESNGCDSIQISVDEDKTENINVLCHGYRSCYYIYQPTQSRISI